jgi:hypothetical protein
LLHFHSAAYSAGLTIESPRTATNEDTILLPIALTVGEGEEVSGLQFDLLFDPSDCQLVSVTSGDAANAADKSVNVNTIAPGKVRVLIAGFNLNTFSNGTVANVTLEAEANSAFALASLDKVLLSDPRGLPVTVSVVNTPEANLPSPVSSSNAPPSSKTGIFSCQSGQGVPSATSSDIILLILSASALACVGKLPVGLKLRQGILKYRGTRRQRACDDNV